VFRSFSYGDNHGPFLSQAGKRHGFSARRSNRVLFLSSGFGCGVFSFSMQEKVNTGCAAPFRNCLEVNSVLWKPRSVFYSLPSLLRFLKLRSSFFFRDR